MTFCGIGTAVRERRFSDLPNDEPVIAGAARRDHHLAIDAIVNAANASLLRRRDGKADHRGDRCEPA